MNRYKIAEKLSVIKRDTNLHVLTIYAILEIASALFGIENQLKLIVKELKK